MPQQCYKLGNSSAMQQDSVFLNNVLALGIAQQCIEVEFTSAM